MNRYLRFSCTYGFLRGLVRTGSLTTGPDELEPLPGTKLACVAALTAAAPFTLPIYLLNDMNRLYMRFKGIDPKLYGYETRDKNLLTMLYE